MLRNPNTLKAAGLSVGLHLAAVAAIAFGLALPSQPQVAPPQDTDQPIQAFAVDTAAVQAEVDRQQAQEAAARAAEQQRQQQLAEQERAARVAREREEQRRQDAVRQREETQRQQQQEEARLAATKQEQAREAEQLKKLQAEKAAVEEAKRKADEQARLERERKAREEAERKKAEQERLKAEEAKRQEAERRKAEEAKRRAEEEKRKVEEEARRAQAAADELQQRIRAAVPGWQNVVKAHVHRYWALPPGSYSGRESLVEIRLALNGTVQGVRTVRSSGDASFDRLAEATIQKASPLPMPGDPEVAKAFANQGVQFIFRPSQ